MSIGPGTRRLGPYEITALLGAGDVEAYKRDTKAKGKKEVQVR